MIVDALKDRYPLPLLKKLTLPKSCYYYQLSARKKKDKYSDIRKKISILFHDNNGRYGYRRIHALLSREGHVISEKVVRRIMTEDELVVRNTSKRKYNSYQGEISPSVPNVLNRDFHAERPNEKWLTDITEFAIPAGKVYLSPIVDCFDGMLPYWTISTTPDAALVNDMLDGAISLLGETEYPIVQSDRGCHYRWLGWISRMEKAGLKRSMSRRRFAQHMDMQNR